MIQLTEQPSIKLYGHNKPFFSDIILKFQIMVQDNAVFEMIAIAQELGLEELRQTCEDHVTSTLSVVNACTFLAAALEIQDRAAGKLPLIFKFKIFNKNNT